jgi:hypothetical protein
VGAGTLGLLVPGGFPAQEHSPAGSANGVHQTVVDLLERPCRRLPQPWSVSLQTSRHGSPCMCCLRPFGRWNGGQ